jgi:membrane protease YdiL (CAAX protease family)
MRLALADRRTLALAVSAEAGLAVVGAVLCWLFGLPLAERLLPSSGLGAAVAQGLVATLPMLALLLVLLRSHWRPLARLRRLVDGLVGELLQDAGIVPMALIALAAGFGEEVLFRGAMQPAFGEWLTPWGGIAAAALLFGLAHPMSLTYFVLATLLGLYLGAITLWTGELIPAIVAHALYDFVALVWLKRATSRDR